MASPPARGPAGLDAHLPPDEELLARFGDGIAEIVDQLLEERWFARAWAKAVGSVGSFERIDAPSARRFDGYTVVDVPLAFGAGGAIGEVVFGRDGQVAGLKLEFPYPRPRQLEPGQPSGTVIPVPSLLS